MTPANGLVFQEIVEPRHVRLDRGSIIARRRHGLFERLHVGLLGRPLQPVGVVLLARNHALFRQVVPALGRHPRQVLVAPPLLQRRFRLLDRAVGLVHRRLGLSNLLVQFGSFDLGQNLPLFHPVADIGVAPLDVAAGARQDRRFRDRLDVARQNQAALVIRTLHFLHVDHRQAVHRDFRFRRQHRFAAPPRQVPREEPDDHERHQHQGDRQ
jgi:hypothetical protein